MDQCSSARHPTSTTGPLTKPPRHDLVIDLRPTPGIHKVLTDSRLGQQHAGKPAIAVPLGDSVCPRGDLNPHALLRALAPQASASTYSATQTCGCSSRGAHEL